MKICTDSLLFGASVAIQGGEQVLDIGSGCGILALMLTQRGVKTVTAVEIDPAAGREAALNFANSPWPGQLTLVQQSIQGFAKHCQQRFDLIISNPPFFVRHLPSALPSKRLARHTDLLSHPELIAIAKQLLTANGRFCVLLPSQAIAEFTIQARKMGLYLVQQTHYQAVASKPAKVAALEFGLSEQTCLIDNLTVFDACGDYSQLYQAYLQTFLLRFAQLLSTAIVHPQV